MENFVPNPPKHVSTEIVFLSPWLKQEFPDFYAHLTSLLSEHGVQHSTLPHTNDYWCRDFMPFLVKNISRFVLYRYNPDYLLKPKNLQQYITDASKICEAMHIPYVQTDLILDGGNMVQAGDYLMMTEKIFNENPNKSSQEIKEELEGLTGLKLLLLPWDTEEKYGHADGIVRRVNAHTVLMTNYEDFDTSIAAEIEKRLARHFKVLHLKYDVVHPDERNWAYINFLDLDNLIILPALDIPEDQQAMKQMRKIFPHKKIVSIQMADVIAEGGALNCLTWTIERDLYSSLHLRSPKVQS